MARPADVRSTALRGTGQRTTAPAWDRLTDATWPEVEGLLASGRTTARVASAGTTACVASGETTACVASGETTLLVPLGATEQHGPHLPLGTDSFLAVALAEAAAALAVGAVVAPLLPYGSSGEHQGFAGTLSIGAEATELILVELGRSASETFERLLFVNAHGGNAAPLAAALERLRYEGRDVRAWSPRFGGDAHAGRTETSLMLALEAVAPLPSGRPALTPADRGRPGLVMGLPGSTAREEALRRSTTPGEPEQRSTAVRGKLAEAGNTAPLRDLIDTLRDEGVRAVSANGVLGDPAGASADEGRALFAAAVEDLRATLAAWPAASVDTAPASRPGSGTIRLRSSREEATERGAASGSSDAGSAGLGAGS